MRLYELADQYRQLSEALDANGGELTPELEAAFAKLDDDIGAKVDAIGALIAEKKAESKAYMDQYVGFMAKRMAAENEAERLKSYLMDCLTQAGLDKAKGRLFTASRRRASMPTIHWNSDPAEIPDRYRITETTHRPNYSLIRDAISSGKELPKGFEVNYTAYVEVR